MSPRKHHFSDCFPNLFCQIGTPLTDRLEMENYKTNNDIKGAKRKEEEKNWGIPSTKQNLGVEVLATV